MRLRLLPIAISFLASCANESPQPAPATPFVVPIPAGATVRHAQARGTRASTLFTTEASPAEVVAFYERTFAARELRVASQHVGGPRDRHVVEGEAGNQRAARVEIERGAARITRVTVVMARPSGSVELPTDEPRAWRRIARPPLPAPPGEGVPECAAAILAACEAWARNADDDALTCALEHRGPCIPVADESYLARSIADALARVHAALQAYERVGSNAARAETRALVELELVAAEIVVARANASPRLRAAVDAAYAEGHRRRIDPIATRAWFAGATNRAPP